jgi:hypothetical protein
MAWTSMHFAVGMSCAGAAFGVGCLALRRGWRWLPAVMTLGGLWAIVPDSPRLWREDFPWLPFASTLGAKSLEDKLHSIGDLFFFHKSLDAQPHEYALHGLMIMLLLYNASIALLMWLERRQRNSLGNRAWRAHEAELRRARFPTATPLRFDGRDVRSSHLHRTG